MLKIFFTNVNVSDKSTDSNNYPYTKLEKSRSEQVNLHVYILFLKHGHMA